MHRLTLTITINGTEEWVCPDCGRIVHITWTPFRCEVIAEGADVIHNGWKK